MTIEPEVRLVAKTSIDFDAIVDYVDNVGGEKWTSRILDEFREESPETLVEFAGRICYRSWDEKLNPNVTKVRQDSKEYLENIVKSGHGSVLEHITFTFVISNVSRVFTHELVRHRVGTAISQESMRYVRLDKIPFKMPTWVASNSKVQEKAEELLKASEDFQKLCAEEMNLDGFGTTFAQKKLITSDMRRFAPEGVLTSIVWTANARTLRDVIQLRTSVHAERELRDVFDKIAQIAKTECPSLFADIERQNDESWVSNLV